MKSNDKKSHAAKEHTKAKKEFPKTVDPGSPVVIPPNGDHAKPKEHSDETEHWRRRIKLLLEVGTFLLASLVLWFTYDTLREVRKQTPAIIEATNTANRNLEISERAYITIGTPIWFELSHQKGFSNVLRMPVENYGHVPTTTVTTSLWCTIVTAKKRVGVGVLPKAATVFFVRDSIRISHKDVINPNSGSDYSIYVSLPISISMIRDIMIGKKAIAIIGNLAYDTGFNKVDSAGICFSYNPIDSTWIKCGSGPTVEFKEMK